jgi:predicted dehydrogenase
MEMTEPIQVGLIGLGFIGKMHATAYRDIPLCFSDPAVTANLAAVLRSNLHTETEFMREVGFGLATSDMEEFLHVPLDVVDVCSPNMLHKEQVERALARGIHVYCEKPLALNLGEAREMVQMAKDAGVLTHMAFVFRYLPGIHQMKTMLTRGEIGEVLNFRGHMFHGSYLNPERPMSWRLRSAEAGGGVLVDLGVHMFDLVHTLLGRVSRVKTLVKTFISERPSSRDSAIKEKVDVDDWAHCTLELENGVVGVVEVTRMAAGAEQDYSLEIFGSQGSLAFDVREPTTVSHFDIKKGYWTKGIIDRSTMPGGRPIETLWPPTKFSQGMMTNAHLACAYDFLQCIAEGKPSTVDFSVGLASQEVLEACYLSARKGETWVKLPLTT